MGELIVPHEGFHWEFLPLLEQGFAVVLQHP